MLINVKFNEQKRKLNIGFDENKSGLAMKFQHYQRIVDRGNAEIYKGEYDITPKTMEQKLKTAQKFLAKDVTAPKATFSGTGGTYKVYGYGKGTTSSYAPPKYAFCGDKYYEMASWGNDTTTSLSIEVDSSGNISGLPSLRSGELTIVRTP